MEAEVQDTCERFGHMQYHPERIRLLTHREREIALMVARGCQNPEIGAALHLRPGSVWNRCKDIYHKVGLRSRTELAVWMLTGYVPIKSERMRTEY